MSAMTAGYSGPASDPLWTAGWLGTLDVVGGSVAGIVPLGALAWTGAVTHLLWTWLGRADERRLEAALRAAYPRSTRCRRLGPRARPHRPPGRAYARRRHDTPGGDPPCAISSPSHRPPAASTCSGATPTMPSGPAPGARVAAGPGPRPGRDPREPAVVRGAADPSDPTAGDDGASAWRCSRSTRTASSTIATGTAGRGTRGSRSAGELAGTPAASTGARTASTSSHQVATVTSGIAGGTGRAGSTGSGSPADRSTLCSASAPRACPRGEVPWSGVALGRSDDRGQAARGAGSAQVQEGAA